MPFSKDENRHSGYPDKCFLICNETKSFTFQGMVSVGGHVDIVCASIYVKILQLTSFAATFQKISLIWELHPLTAMDLINTPFCREIV